MSVDIDTLFEMMDEGQPAEIQEEALREARKIKSLSVFMQPIEYGWSWGIRILNLMGTFNVPILLYG